ncbi:MAG: c-type cytochrome [Acidobacteria bacterium]|nr:c-type cytochrome [Acidobacteriota bacterium]
MRIIELKISRLDGRFVGVASVLSLFLVTAMYAVQATPAAAKESPESIANGEAIFKRHCQMCHGATGVGDGPAAKTLKGKLPNLTKKATMARYKDEQIHEAIAMGLKTGVGNMPAFEKKLKPEGIQDVINYVRTLAK